MQAGQVSGGVHFYGGGPGAAGVPAPRQLPAGPTGFVDRRAELARLHDFLDDGRETSCAVITGTAGAGKTAAALSWAHQVEDRFPDGQLYIDLRGYDPGWPVEPGEALRRFLVALGVPPESVPDDVDSAAALYRSLLHERTVLVVLDNAASAGQVRPLLPGNPACLAVVTSRNRLSGLSVRDGARRITLGTFPRSEAVRLLGSILREYRGEEAEPERLEELAELCGGLPLALRIAAERAAAHPHMRLADLVADLRDESALWTALSTDDGEEGETVRGVFAWSYRALPAPAARLFRLLGLHPGAEFGLEAAAALAAMPLTRTRQLLDSLVGAHLLEQVGPDRYQFHDLLRAYAAGQAAGEEPAAERERAVQRVSEWYLSTADAAQARICPEEPRVPLDGFGSGVRPLVFHDYDPAVDWAEKEHRNLLGAIRAAASGREALACRLALVLCQIQPSAAAAATALEACELGIEAARRCGEPAIEAELLMQSGMELARTNRIARSLECYERALELAESAGDAAAKAHALNLIGLVHLRRREFAAAADRFQVAARVFREQGAGHWVATTLSNLASTRFRAGELDAAGEVLDEALAAHRDLGDQAGEGNALRLRAELLRDRGAVEAALEAAGEALEIAIKLRDQRLEGYWLLVLGDAQRDSGRLEEAQTSYHRSAMLHRRLKDDSREAIALQGTGHVYRALGRPREAAEFFRHAATVHSGLADRWNEALALDGLATALSEQDDPGAVREWARCVDLLAEFTDPRATALRERLATLLDGQA